MFGTKALAEATVARIGEHIYSRLQPAPDPIYAEGDFATEFFTGVRQDMETLVNDPATRHCSAPSAEPDRPHRSRPWRGNRMPAVPSPSPIRARCGRSPTTRSSSSSASWPIPCTGRRAAGGAPDLFVEMRERSERFARAFRLVQEGPPSATSTGCAPISTPSTPRLARAGAPGHPDGRREEIVAVAAALDRLNLAPTCAACSAG